MRRAGQLYAQPQHSMQHRQAHTYLIISGDQHVQTLLKF
jgi:hypothetical protein